MRWPPGDEINNSIELLVGDIDLETAIAAVDNSSSMGAAAQSLQLAGATIYPPTFSNVFESGGYFKVRTTWGRIKSLFR